jgi:hypothetical protein
MMLMPTKKGRGDQRGEGRVGFFIALIIFAIVVFLGVKFIPVKVKSYQFSDFMRDEARRAAWSRDESKLQKLLIQKARSLDLPITEKNLKVVRGGGQIVVSATYEVPIDLAVTTYVWRFDQEERAPLF